MKAQLYRDPIYDGATDPILVEQTIEGMVDDLYEPACDR